MTRTGRRQRKEREETGELQGTGNLGESGRGGRREERGGPEPPSDGKSSTLNFKGQSLGISQAAVQGMEQHHPIMDKLGDPEGQTYTQIERMTLFKAITLKKTNKTRIQYEERLSKERVEIRDKPSICGTSSDSSN